MPDSRLSAAENQKAAADLAALSAKLQALLPDDSLSPFERLERLARAVEPRKPDLNQLQSAAVKVAALRKRLDQLVPGKMPPERKIDVLTEKLDALLAQQQRGWRTINKLELLGDPRGRVAPERPARRRSR